MKRIDHYVSCLTCQVSFRAPPKNNRQFCSKPCRDQYMRGKPNPKPGRITLTCPQCDKVFTAPQSNHTKYCSKDCYTAAQTGKPSGKLIEHYINCAQCGVSFRAPPSLNRKFCSRECADANLIGKPSKKRNRIPHICPQCDTVFEAAPSNHRVHCSKACHNKSKEKVKIDKACECCGVHFQVLLSADDTRFCSTKCRYSYLSGERNSKWKPNITLTCEQCSCSFERKPSQSHIRFCSRLCRNHWLRNNIVSPTGIEIAIENVLIDTGVPFEIQAQIGKWSCDFLIPSSMLVIECDGDYWHNLPRTKRKDAIKDQELFDQGYFVLHLSEADINKRIETCIDRIKLALLYQVPPQQQQFL